MSEIARLRAQTRRPAGRQRLPPQSGAPSAGLRPLSRPHDRARLLRLDRRPRGAVRADGALGQTAPGRRRQGRLLRGRIRIRVGGGESGSSSGFRRSYSCRTATRRRAPSAWNDVSIILDPMLRVIDVAPLDEADRALAHLGDPPPPGEALEPSPPAPILVLPHVFEPELCAHLIACFERGGGKESGFMQDQGGRAIENFDGALEAPARFPSDRPAPHRQLESARRAKDLSGDQEGVSDALDPDRARPRCAL